MENPYPRPQMPQKIGAPLMCVAPTHRFALGCLAQPIKRKYVSMQYLGIKSLLHLGPSGGDSCAWTSRVML
jgi:hypothetical protein